MNAPFALNAALFGARALRGHWRVLAALAVVHGAVAFFVEPAFAPARGAWLDAWLVAGEPQTNPDEMDRMSAAFARLTPFMAVEFVLYVISTAALLRALVRDNSQGGVFGVWLGADELRVGAVTLVTGAAVLAAVGCGQVLGLGLGAAIGWDQAGASAGAILGFAAGLWTSARLAPAAAASVGEGAVVLRGAWRLTRGRFGAVLLATGLVVVAMMIITSIVGSLLMPPLGDEGESLERVLGALAADPVGRIRLSLIAAANPVLVALVAGVGAYAYRVWGAEAGFTGARPPFEGSP